MSLTSLFNFSYLKENMKKSKAIILLCIFLVPIVNAIIYLMKAVNEKVFIPEYWTIASLLTAAMYIVPVVLAITLFNFVYKRKSCDFVASMPLSRSQIFLTNTVGGIIVLLIMQLINLIFMVIISSLFSNILIDYRMLLDIFLIYSISYIFVFTSVNLAMTVSSNKITTVVVTMLILFLVPFINTFIEADLATERLSNTSVLCENEACQPKNFECYDINCEVNRKKGIYKTYLEEVHSNTNTMPYAVIESVLFNGNHFKMNSSLIKMVIISVLEIISGLFLFKMKKFEVVETSFKSEKVHLFVRSLTTVPIVCICYLIMKESSFTFPSFFLTLLFLLVIVMTYLIVYDLITRKKVVNVFKSLACLCMVTIVVILTGGIINKEDEIIKVDDIEKMTFNNEQLVNNLGYTKNKDIINGVMSILLDNRSSGEFYSHFDITIDTKDGSYKSMISTDREQYESLVSKLNNDKEYMKSGVEFKNNNVFAVNLQNGNTNISKDSKLYQDIITKFKKSNGILTDSGNSLFNINLYYYDNYNVNNIKFNVSDDKKISEEILNLYNMEVKKYFDKGEIDIWSYYVGDETDEDYINSNDYSKLNSFIVNSLDDKIDIKKEYSYIRLYASDNNYIFITNRVEELNDIVSRIGEDNEKYAD